MARFLVIALLLGCFEAQPRSALDLLEARAQFDGPQRPFLALGQYRDRFGLACAAGAAKHAHGNAMGRPPALRRRMQGHRHGLSERCERRFKLFEPIGMVESE
jgi:hypothetical protein